MNLRALKYYGYFKRHLFAYWKLPYLLARKRLNPRRLLAAELFFESRCNLHCWHCSSRTIMRDTPSMTLADVSTAIRQCKRVGVFSICYVGGEPLVRKDLEDIIRLTKRARILPSLISNATLATPERLDALYDAGLANAGFSLQSMDPAKHDELVAFPGAHAHLLDAIDHCLGKGHTCSICVVPTNENLRNGDFESMVAYATERSMRINANLPASIGKMLGEDTFLLDPKAMDILMRQYFPLDNFQPDFKQFNDLDTPRCPMGDNLVYILPSGDVCPCTFTHVNFGNILKEDMYDIMGRLHASKTLRTLDRAQCPVSMDRAFIDKLNSLIAQSSTYPPDWKDLDA